MIGPGFAANVAARDAVVILIAAAVLAVGAFALGAWLF